MQLINHVRKFTRLSSLLSTALLLASAFVSSQAYALDYISNSTTSVFTNQSTWKDPASSGMSTCTKTGFYAGTAALTSTDSVFVCGGTTVTLAAPASIGRVSLMGGTLALGANDLTVSTNVESSASSSSVTSSGGSLVLTDANHILSLWNGGSGVTIPKLTLPNPTVTRTLSFTNDATFTALSGIPTTSAGKGFVFDAGSSTVDFPVGTTIAYCEKRTVLGAINNLTCTNPSGVLPLPAVSAPIFSLKDKPAIFSEEVK